VKSRYRGARGRVCLRLEFSCRAGEENCYEYVLRPEIKTFAIKNSAKLLNTSEDVKFMALTWSADLNRSNFLINDAFAESVCETYDNDNCILGPCVRCIRVRSRTSVDGLSASYPRQRVPSHRSI